MHGAILSRSLVYCHNASVDVTVVFLGKRGAGARFVELFKAYEKSFNEARFSYLISRACLRRNPSLVSGSFKVRTFESLPWLLATPIILMNQIVALVRITKFRRRVFIFVLPSPSDYFLIRILRVFQFPVVIFIHDDNHHSGDMWPNKLSVIFRIRNATRIIVLSRFMKSRLTDLGYKNAHLIDHPIFPITNVRLLDDQLELPDNFLLFIGRVRDYKGVNDLLEAFESIQTEVMLVIAGEGKIPPVLDGRVKVFNRWLTDSEIDLLIAKSRFVVFPYRDATQSGLIPICIALKKRIIVSDAGALFEQTKGAENVGLFKAGDISSLSVQIEHALTETASLETFVDKRLEDALRSSDLSGQKFMRQILEICRFC
jgi:glycosyltransferase involved in cell wall biosynthesis